MYEDSLFPDFSKDYIEDIGRRKTTDHVCLLLVDYQMFPFSVVAGKIPALLSNVNV